MHALYTGMRRGELFNLKWEHIDFHNGFLNIAEPKKYLSMNKQKLYQKVRERPPSSPGGGCSHATVIYKVFL